MQKGQDVNLPEIIDKANENLGSFLLGCFLVGVFVWAIKDKSHTENTEITSSNIKRENEKIQELEINIGEMRFELDRKADENVKLEKRFPPQEASSKL